MRNTAEDLIERLSLAPHPEGGYFRETYRSDLQVPERCLAADYGGPRAGATSILFLLRAGERSAWHRVRSDELWIHQAGDPVLLRIADDPVDTAAEMAVGTGNAQDPQVLVPGGMWQTAYVAAGGSAGYALVACVVVPGFDFEDFELVR